MSPPQELRERTRNFAIRVIRLFQALPESSEEQILGKQLLRWGTSVAANYRAACRGRSRAEFISRMGVVAEEADENILWLELLEETGILSAKRLSEISNEAKELTAIFSTSLKTAKDNAKEDT